jgi:hypothetical protein
MVLQCLRCSRGLLAQPSRFPARPIMALESRAAAVEAQGVQLKGKVRTHDNSKMCKAVNFSFSNAVSSSIEGEDEGSPH